MQPTWLMDRVDSITYSQLVTGHRTWQQPIALACGCSHSCEKSSQYLKIRKFNASRSGKISVSYPFSWAGPWSHSPPRVLFSFWRVPVACEIQKHCKTSLSSLSPAGCCEFLRTFTILPKGWHLRISAESNTSSTCLWLLEKQAIPLFSKWSLE